MIEEDNSIQLFFKDVKRILLFLLFCSPYLLFKVYLSSSGYYLDPDKEIIEKAVQKNQIIKTIKIDKSIQKEFFGTKALTIAVSKGNYPFAKSLLEAGVNPNTYEYVDDYPLVELASNEASYPNNKDTDNRIKIVQLLLDYGTDVNFRDVNGGSALLSAAKWGNIKLAELLIHYGGNVNIKTDNGRTPLIEVVDVFGNPFWDETKKKSYKPMVKLLIHAGANPYVRVNNEDWGGSALDHSKKQKNQEIMEILQASQSTANLISYERPKSKLSQNAKNLDQKMRGRGFKLNPKIYQFITDRPFMWLFLPSILTGIYGGIKNDKFFIRGSSLMFLIIVVTFIFMFSTFKDS